MQYCGQMPFCTVFNSREAMEEAKKNLVMIHSSVICDLYHHRHSPLSIIIIAAKKHHFVFFNFIDIFYHFSLPLVDQSYCRKVTLLWAWSNSGTRLLKFLNTLFPSSSKGQLRCTLRRRKRYMAHRESLKS